MVTKWESANKHKNLLSLQGTHQPDDVAGKKNDHYLPTPADSKSWNGLRMVLDEDWVLAEVGGGVAMVYRRGNRRHTISKPRL